MNDQLFKPGQEAAFMQACNALAHRNSNPADRQLVTAALQAHMMRPARQRAQIQAAMTRTDMPEITQEMPQIFMETSNFDFGYEFAFREVPVAPDRLSWQIFTVTNGLTFEKIPEGDKLKVNKLTGNAVTVKIPKFGAALDWTQELIMDRDLATMLDRAQAFRYAFWKTKADVHYTLLTSGASTAGTTSWQFATGDTQLEADIKTLNAAAQAIKVACKDKSFMDVANAELVLFVNLNGSQMQQRILRALGELSQAYAGSQERVVHRIRPVFTFNSNMPATTTSCVMALPGGKLQRVTKQEPTFYESFDESRLAWIQTVWSFYGAAVADTAQLKTVAFA